MKNKLMKYLNIALLNIWLFQAVAGAQDIRNFDDSSYERRDITFISNGLKCAGWYYVSKNVERDKKYPAIVMAQGFSALKEMGLDKYAVKFTRAGFIVLAFDYRYFGASDGEPRGQLFYYEQIEDYRNAVTWISLQKEVDATRIGVWGTSFSGAHVLFLSTFDKRIKVAVAQQAFTGVENLPESISNASGWLGQIRKNEYLTGNINYIPVVDSIGSFAALPGKEAYQWFKNASANAPAWKNQVTVKSIEKIFEYNPQCFVHLNTTTPVLMVITSDDGITPSTDQLRTYELIRAPKKLIIVSGGHFDASAGPGFEKFYKPAIDWFKNYLNLK